jgi:hypothetical protein
MLKQSEETIGERLAGVVSRVSATSFTLRLSIADIEARRNSQLIAELSWFDIPIVYENGRRAILAVNKDNQVFAK